MVDENRHKLWGYELLKWIITILIALMAAYLFKAFLFERALVEGASMNNTLHDKQTLIEFKLGTLFGAPNRGDIVVFEYKSGKYDRNVPLPDPDEIDYIKRVIALPGETIDIKNGFVFISNSTGTGRLDEPYAVGDAVKFVNGISLQYPLKLGNDEVFVMGDNRYNSSDSRVFGPVKLSKIRGTAVFRISPLMEMGFVNTKKPTLVK